jgi:hypothetical protein
MTVQNDNSPEKTLFVGGKRLFSVDLIDLLDGDALTGSATWSTSSGNITTSSPSNSSTVVSVWITAGSTAGTYSASFSVNTVAGAIITERLIIHVQPVTPP